MKLEIVRIENRVVTCKIEDMESLIEIAKRWFTDDIQVGDIIEIDITNKK